MKLNFYSFLVFSLILIITYPIIFYFSDKRINMSNNNLITYEYNITGFLSLNNIMQSTFEAKTQTKNLNNKYFDGKNILKFNQNILTLNLLRRKFSHKID